MPNLNGKKSAPNKKSNGVAPRKKQSKTKQSSKERDSSDSASIIEYGTAKSSNDVQSFEHKVIDSFSDGLVSSRFREVVVPTTCYGSREQLVRGFMSYFQSEIYVGSIVTQSSYMKRKGGVLL